MSAFLQKPNSSTRKGIISVEKPSGSAPTSATVSSSSTHDDFSKSFKPFVIKKDASVAPINWFQHQKRMNEIIVIDVEQRSVPSADVEMQDITQACDPRGACFPLLNGYFL